MGALSSSLSWHFPISSRSHDRHCIALCTLLGFPDFDSDCLKVCNYVVDPKKEVAQPNFQKSKSTDWEFFSSSLSWHFPISSHSHDRHCTLLGFLSFWFWVFNGFIQRKKVHIAQLSKIKGNRWKVFQSTYIYLVVFTCTVIKYRGPILHVMSPALGSDVWNLDQSAMSIQILPEPNAVTWHVFFIKLWF